MSLSLNIRNQAAGRTMRTGWVWSVVDEMDYARVEYAAGACPTFFHGAIGTKRNQPNPGGPST